MTPDDIKAVFPTLSSVDWQKHDADRLERLLREKGRLEDRYRTLLTHPNPMFAADAHETVISNLKDIASVRDRLGIAA